MPITNLELQQQLTKLIKDSVSELKVETQSLKDEMFEKITNTLGVIETRLNQQDDYITRVTNRVEKLEEKVDLHIVDYKQSHDLLVQRVADLEKELKAVESVPNNVKDIKENMEERTNRQLRETLIFKNVPEQEKETYDQTREVLAQLISTHTNIEYDTAFQNISRCHREKPDKNDGKRNGKRHIYAKFQNWYMCQDILDSFKQKCINDNNFCYAVDQMYGPMTTKRRGLAFLKRKQLKEQNTITGGYVDYPARLFVHVAREMMIGRKVY